MNVADREKGSCICDIPELLANLGSNGFLRHLLLENKMIGLAGAACFRNGLSIIPETSKHGSLLATLFLRRVLRDQSAHGSLLIT